MEPHEPLLTALGHLARELDAASSPEALLAALADGARGILPFTACALARPGAAGWRVWRTTAARPAAVVLNPSIPPSAETTLARFLAHGQPLHIRDLLSPPWSDANHRDVLWKEGTRSALLLPLRRRAAPMGTLSFTSSQPDRYHMAEEAAGGFLAWMTATALHALPADQERA